MSATNEPSAMDVSQFQDAFLEEASEHLAEMEALLVRIDAAAPADDDLNAIFRAAHSLKGGSAMFGFTDMTTLTHELESVLDRVRKRELALHAGMIDTLLASADLLRAQLAHFGGQAGEPATALEAMCERVRACHVVAASPSQPVAPTGMPEAANVAGPRTLEIVFPVNDQTTPLIPDLLAQLGELGTLTEIASEPATASKKGRRKKRTAGPATRAVRLVTQTSDDVVLALFEFVMDASSVTIATLAEPAGVPSEDAERESAQGYGFFQPLPVPEPAPSAAVPAASGQAAHEAAPLGESKATPRGQDVRAAETTIRVGVEKVDQLINQVGELVITQAMLAQSVAQLDPVAHQKLVAGMADLERNTRDLQQSVMSIRMLPISSVFNRFPRLARDLAAKLGKQVQLVMQGEGTELDKGLIEKIADPLTHLVRNAIDHGIETPQQRLDAGKPAAGTVTLRAAHQGGSIVIQVADDGGGLKRDRILAKAQERGLAVSPSMSDSEVWSLIFEAGFSTAEAVTDVSGRGVGMDVVKRNIASLGGSVDIESAAGWGTRITVRLPLTLAIMDGMSIAVGSDVYILPLTGIVESLQVTEGQVKSIAGQGRVIDVRSEFLPVLSLHELLGDGSHGVAQGSRTMVIVESEGGKTALLVDELLGQHQVVVKSLDTNYRKVPGISGATIMGDGRVALILDAAALTRGGRQAHAPLLQ